MSKWGQLKLSQKRTGWYIMLFCPRLFQLHNVLQPWNHHLSRLSMDKSVNTLYTADALGDTGVCINSVFVCMCVWERKWGKREVACCKNNLWVQSCTVSDGAPASASQINRPELVRCDDARLYMSVENTSNKMQARPISLSRTPPLIHHGSRRIERATRSYTGIVRFSITGW